MSMSSFTVTGIGYLAADPEVVTRPTGAYTRFAMIGNDYAGKDNDGRAREVSTSVRFAAFGSCGDAIARHAKKGTQLIVTAKMRSNKWTDNHGQKRNDHSFIVEGFKFGRPAKEQPEGEQTAGEHSVPDFDDDVLADLEVSSASEEGP